MLLKSHSYTRWQNKIYFIFSSLSVVRDCNYQLLPTTIYNVTGLNQIDLIKSNITLSVTPSLFLLAGFILLLSSAPLFYGWKNLFRCCGLNLGHSQKFKQSFCVAHSLLPLTSSMMKPFKDRLIIFSVVSLNEFHGLLLVRVNQEKRLQQHYDSIS